MYHTPAPVTLSSALPLKPFVSAARRLTLLCLVVAVLFQGFVTQTHRHIGADRIWVASASTLASAAAVDNKKDTPTTPACPLCEERALFGAYLLGGSVAIAAPVEATYRYATPILTTLSFGASSHAWRSRAPPILTA